MGPFRSKTVHFPRNHRVLLITAAAANPLAFGLVMNARGMLLVFYKKASTKIQVTIKCYNWSQSVNHLRNPPSLFIHLQNGLPWANPNHHDTAKKAKDLNFFFRIPKPCLCLLSSAASAASSRQNKAAYLERGDP